MLTVLRDITPDNTEKKALLNTAGAFIKKLNSKLNKEGKAILGGSVAKNTWLKGDHDIDIFVMFNKKYKKEDISSILEKRLKNLGDINKISGIRKVHGSRDYFQIRKEPYTFEIVPIININKAKNAVNITDVSPLHSKWVSKRANKKILDQIRLTKAFCKANNIYGAESYIKGFSGYTLEILTIYYKSFSKLMKEAVNWKKGQIIDVEKHFDGLNKSKESPLIVIDPVQHDRNTSAALSENKFNKFIELAKEFNRNPSREFFIRKKVSLDDLKGAVILKAIPLKGKNDVVGSKLLKSFEFIAKRLKEEGYKIDDYNWEWNKHALFWYFVKNKTLPKKYKHFGPPVKEEEHLKKFKEKYKNKELKKQGNRVYIELKRENPYVLDFLKKLLKHLYLRDKVKDIGVLKE
ncbi:MAG: CCA tRNA nucleotidyltransferase [Nanoarchaeota archaeon]|nr:CCA tRNA nucleotidyltransferase [Nanoarchaeota archaeon]